MLNSGKTILHSFSEIDDLEKKLLKIVDHTTEQKNDEMAAFYLRRVYILYEKKFRARSDAPYLQGHARQS
jgi:hypothetical protein